jgi:hypothetical protein
MPYPVHLATRWFSRETGGLVLEGARNRLEPPLRPGARRSYRIEVIAPGTPGEYRLGISLVQEHVAWFDEVAVKNGSSVDVTVKPVEAA